MKVIGLTGGIGTGKSTVSSYLKDKGCLIIDTDQMSRQMTEKSSPVLDVLKERFGAEYFTEDGDLDRKKLASLVFNDESKREILESIVTQKVIDDTQYMLSQLQAGGYDGIVIIDAPLLFECGVNAITDENWVVICDLEERIKRVQARDNASREEIIARINNQMSDDEKMQLADRVIDNSTDITDLYFQLDTFLFEEGIIGLNEAFKYDSDITGIVLSEI